MDNKLSDQKVYKTQNYGIFKSLVGNRELNKMHVLRLTSAVMKENLLAENPIIVNSNFEVIDGQHRLEVARANDLEIYYVIHPDLDIASVQMLNWTVLKWSTKDFLDSYVERGYTEYIKLQEYANRTGMSLSICRLILGGKGATLDTEGLRVRFQAGEFKVENPELGEMFANIIEDLRTVTEFKEERDKQLIIATSKILKQVDFQEMMRQFEASGKKIKRAATTRDYLRQYEDVYNYNKKGAPTRFY